MLHVCIAYVTAPTPDVAFLYDVYANCVDYDSTEDIFLIPLSLSQSAVVHR